MSTEFFKSYLSDDHGFLQKDGIPKLKSILGDRLERGRVVLKIKSNLKIMSIGNETKNKISENLLIYSTLNHNVDIIESASA